MRSSNLFRFTSLSAFFGLSFFMHLLWENGQMPLFESGDAPLRETFMMCLFATATGDMLFMLTLYLTVAAVHRDLWWLSNIRSYSHPATWIVPAVVGVLLAVSFELWAVHVVHRWQYSSMPLIPLVQVGLTPVFQMILIPPAILAICGWLAKRQASSEVDRDTARLA